MNSHLEPPDDHHEPRHGRREFGPVLGRGRPRRLSDNAAPGFSDFELLPLDSTSPANISSASTLDHGTQIENQAEGLIEQEGVVPDSLGEQVDGPADTGSEIALEGRRYEQNWLWEALGIITSLVSMIAVIVTLSRLQNTPLHNWKFYFQPNTVISVLVVISRLKWIYYWRSDTPRSLADLEFFNQASQGPWGATLFYSHMRRHFIPLSYLASFVVILSPAMGPGAQQVVSFTTRYVSSDGEAAIPISNSYNVKPFVTQTFTNIELFDAQMQGAVYSGLFNTSRGLDFSCPSGNCTWPDFTTFAVCSKCLDVSAATKVTEQNCSTYDLYTNPTNFQQYIRCKKYLFTLPNGGKLSGVIGLKNATGQRTNANGKYWTTSVVSTQVVVNYTSNMPITTNWNLVYVANIAKFQWNSTWNFESAANIMTTSFQATQCSLEFCVKRYSGVAVINGALNNFSTQDISGELRLSNLSKDGMVFTADGQPSELRPWANASNFSIYTNLYSPIFLFLKKGLSFNLTNGGNEQGSISDDTIISHLFFENTNTSGIIHNIAASITDRIRHNYDNVSSHGSVLRPVIYIEVNWIWIILPVAPIVLSAVVLIVTIWLNRRRNTPLWKSGLIPLLFHGLEGWDVNDLRADSTREMERVARTMNARMQENDEEDVRFVRV